MKEKTYKCYECLDTGYMEIYLNAKGLEDYEKRQPTGTTSECDCRKVNEN